MRSDPGAKGTLELRPADGPVGFSSCHGPAGAALPFGQALGPDLAFMPRSFPKTDYFVRLRPAGRVLRLVHVLLFNFKKVKSKKSKK